MIKNNFDLKDINQKEASRKKSLGELGELYALKTLVDNSFDEIRNVNDERLNETFADIVCMKNNIKYVISVKKRNMYQINGTLNSRYNLGSNLFEKAKIAEAKYKGIAHWMAIQFDLNYYSVYFGSIECLNGSTGIPIRKCQSGEIGIILVNRKRHYFAFSFYKNTRDYSNNNETNL